MHISARADKRASLGSSTESAATSNRAYDHEIYGAAGAHGSGGWLVVVVVMAVVVAVVVGVSGCE